MGNFAGPQCAMQIRCNIVLDFAHGNGETKYLADNLKYPARSFVISFVFDALDEGENLRRFKLSYVFFPDDGENVGI